MNSACKGPTRAETISRGSRLLPLVGHLRSGLVALLSFALLLATPGVPLTVVAQGQPPTYQRAVAELESTIDLLGELRKAIDVDAYSVDELAFELAFEEPNTIARWVADNIAFRPYKGLLQGPRGSTWSRTGNALDQAVLLARLLNDAGLEARIAQGSLSANDARRLVVAGIEQPSGPLAGVDEEIVARVREASLELGIDVSGGQEPSALEELDVYRDILDVAQRVRDAVMSDGEDLLPRDVTGDLTAIAQDYYWVQYRLAEGEAWSDAHPAFGGAEGPAEFGRSEVLVDSVPEERQHRVRIQAYVSRRVGDDVTRDPIMSAWERPAANMHGVSVPFTVIPEGADAELDPSVFESTQFIPTLEGALAPGAQAFDLNGNVVPAGEASTPFAGVFREVADQVNRAAGALGNLGSSEEDEDAMAMQLLGLELELTLVSPGGEERTVVHPIAERTADMDDAAFAEALLGSHNLATSSGRIPFAIALEGVLGKVMDLEPVWREILAQAYGHDTGSRDPVEGIEQELDARVVTRLLFSSLEARWRSVDDTTAFRDEPSIIVYSQDYLPQSASPSINIVSSRWTTLRMAEGGLQSVPSEALRQGVWESAVESEVISAQVEGAAVSTWNAFARGETDPYVVRSVEQLEALRREGDASRVWDQLRGDLGAGYVLILPTDVADRVVAWWRVDPQSGETMGRIAGPLGGAEASNGGGTPRDVHGGSLDPAHSGVRAQAGEDIVVRGSTGTVYISSAKVYGAVITCATALVVAYAFVTLVVSFAASGLPGAGVLGPLIAGLINKLVQGRLLPGTQGAANRAFMIRCTARLLGLPAP